MTYRDPHYGAIIVGGGFYGCNLALALSSRVGRVLIVEREQDLLTRASYVNQARVHNGYHYPRSLLTGMRSAANYPRFTAEFNDCVDHSFLQLYAIAQGTSKVTAYQFRKFCERIGAPLRRAPQDIVKLFNPALIEEVFATEECAFNAVKLRQRMRARLAEAGVEVLYGQEVEKILAGSSDSARIVLSDTTERTAPFVFNCAYSQINRVLTRSGLPTLPLKHELTEMAMIQVPPPLDNVGVTVMDGPYFSTMPFPALGLHSLSHVTYTPHAAWNDLNGSGQAAVGPAPPSKSLFMLRDAARYLPVLSDARYVTSLFETKTVLMQNEVDDGRPILCRRDYGVKGLFVILGAKIDNIYDIIQSVNSANPPVRSTYEFRS